MTLQQLRAERTRHVDALEKVLQVAEAECRVLTAAEDDQFTRTTRAIIKLDEQLEETRMESNEPQGQLRSLVPQSTRLSDGLPNDIAQAIEKSGRIAYTVQTSLRTLSRNIVGESLVAPNVGIAGPTAWRIADGGLALTPLLLELLPTVATTGSGVLQHILDYAPPPDANTGIMAGNKASQVAESASKPESSLAVTTTTVTFPVWAHWLTATRVALSDMPSLRQLLDSILIRGLLQRVDAGIYAVLSGAATAYTPTGANVIDNAVLALSELSALGATNPTCLLNPGDMAKANIQRAEDSGVYLGWPPRIPGTITASPSIPAGTLLCFSSEAAYIAEREAANVTIGVKNDDFVKNLLTLLAEWRGQAVLQQPRLLLAGPAAAGATTPEPQSARHAAAGAPRRA